MHHALATAPRTPASGRAQLPSIDMATAAASIQAAGTPRLARVLLRGMQHKLPVSFCFVLLMPPQGRARLVSGASLYGQSALRAAER